jgi:hypothetical protein
MVFLYLFCDRVAQKIGIPVVIYPSLPSIDQSHTYASEFSCANVPYLVHMNLKAGITFEKGSVSPSGAHGYSKFPA